MTLTTYPKKDLVESLQRFFFKGQKVKIVPFLHFRAFSQKLVSNFFLYFSMNLPRDGTNQLPKAGFD